MANNMNKTLSSLLFSSILLAAPSPLHAQYHSQVWNPDNGNGTYTNPVIYADYSDPDVVAVGEDWFLHFNDKYAYGRVIFLQQWLPPSLHCRPFFCQCGGKARAIQEPFGSWQPTLTKDSSREFQGNSQDSLCLQGKRPIRWHHHDGHELPSLGGSQDGRRVPSPATLLQRGRHRWHRNREDSRHLQAHRQRHHHSSSFALINASK